MRTRLLNLGAIKCGVLCVSAALLAGAGARASDSSSLASLFGQKDETSKDWWQHIHLGLPITMNVKADFKVNGTFALPVGQTGATGTNGVNHVYDDGYVKVDNTGDALGYTSYWGYQNANQYDPLTGLLTMHSATSYTANGSESKTGQPFIGVEAGYGMDLWNPNPFHVGWEFNAGLTPIRITDNASFASTVNQSIFTFNTGGIIMPTAPYNGGPSGIGPTIQDVATAAAPATDANSVVSGTRKLDVMLYTFRLGPTVSWDINDRFRLMGGAGGALGLVSGHYEFDETISTSSGSSARNSGKIWMSKAVYGGYVDATLLYHVIDHGDVYAGARFMPLSGATVSGMGREAKLDLGGALQFSVGVNWPF